jgi:uncharacterized protein
VSAPAANGTHSFNHAGFNQYLAKQRLMAVRCSSCGETFLPPRALCPHCYGTDMQWVELSGEGRLEGFTLIHVGLPAMAAEGYTRQNPYCSGVVRLAEGPAVAAQIVGQDGALPDPIQVGMQLHVVFPENDTHDNYPIRLAFAPSCPVV